MPDPFVSEVKFLGAGNVDFVEIALDAGSDPSNVQIVIYHPNGSVRTTNDLGTVEDTVAGKDIYVIESANSATFNGVHKNGAVAVVEDGVVVQFISFESEFTATNGPAAGMTSTQLGGTGQGESLETTDGGANYVVNDTPSKGTVPCFLEGTLIQTDRGPLPVQDLVMGDYVQTNDSGLQPVLWAGACQLSLDQTSDPMARPIRVPAHALSPAHPAKDTFVSANHRLLFSHVLCFELFGNREVLIAAKFLMGYNGIGHAPVALPIRFHHILLADHHVIRANGMAAESLFHGKIAGEAFSEESSEGLESLATFAEHTKTARRVLKAHEVQRLMRELAREETFHLKVS